MRKCFFCDNPITSLGFNCKYCGKTFCISHRLPENHDCMFDLVSKPLDTFRYHDTIEFIKKDMSVADIYHFFTIKEFSIEKTIELLQFLLQKSDDFKTRMNSILALKLLNLKHDKIFSLLEECIITEKNEKVRNTAIKVIKELYPKKSKNVVKWFSRDSKYMK